MPRESPFSIVLSKEERVALEAQARQYSSPYCDVVRAKIVLLAAAGFSNDIIAARLERRATLYSKWRDDSPSPTSWPGIATSGRASALFSPQRRRPS